MLVEVVILTENGFFAWLPMVPSDDLSSLEFRCLTEVKCYLDVLLLVCNGCAMCVACWCIGDTYLFS
jgi:hypothetical protein